MMSEPTPEYGAPWMPVYGWEPASAAGERCAECGAVLAAICGHCRACQWAQHRVCNGAPAPA